MAESAKSLGLDLDGPTAPPRSNGELLFETPWESRIFGITMALHDAGHFEWDEFRRLLIDEIARWERDAARDPDARWSYYGRWHAALERLLAAKGLCAAAEIESRTLALAVRPPGHDHEPSGTATHSRDARVRPVERPE